MLIVAANEIGAQGAAALAKALEVNASITTIDVASNKIGADGAAALAKALEVNASITNINLGDNQIGADGATACLLYTSPSPRDRTRSRMPSSA